MATHQPGRRHISGHDIAVCSLVHFYVTEAPLNEAGPLLTRLLVYTSRLIFEVSVPKSCFKAFSLHPRPTVKPPL